MQTLANAIRASREKRQWTQGELATRLNVTQGTISFWENGVEVPALDHQVQLIETMPEILMALAAQELSLLDRVQALEREKERKIQSYLDLQDQADALNERIYQLCCTIEILNRQIEQAKEEEARKRAAAAARVPVPRAAGGNCAGSAAAMRNLAKTFTS